MFSRWREKELLIIGVIMAAFGAVLIEVSAHFYVSLIFAAYSAFWLTRVIKVKTEAVE